MKTTIISLLVAALLLTGAATIPGTATDNLQKDAATTETTPAVMAEMPAVIEENNPVETQPTEAKPAEVPAQPADPVFAASDEAVRVALAHAGLTSDQIRQLEAEYDPEHGMKTFEVSFESGDYEYDYVIRSETWEIIADNKEYDPEKEKPAQKQEKKSEPAPKPTEAKPKQEDKKITSQDAVNTALANAGLSADQIRDLESEYDVEKGQKVYEVHFEANGREYEYEIDAETGKVVQKEVERDD